jgi:Flp pilus assembly pilin Flp
MLLLVCTHLPYADRQPLGISLASITHAGEENHRGRVSMRFALRKYIAVQSRWLVRGQTMTEYALILAAVAIVVFVTYQIMGQNIGSLVNRVNTALTAT